MAKSLTSKELRDGVIETGFLDIESVDKIMACVNDATIGNFVIACELAGFTLDGWEIDELISVLA